MTPEEAAVHAGAERDLARQLATLTLARLVPVTSASALQAAVWWNGLARLGINPPLSVVHDFGRLLSQPADRERLLEAHPAGRSTQGGPLGAYEALLRGLALLPAPLQALLGPDLTYLINLGYGDGSAGYSVTPDSPADVATPFGLFPDVSMKDVFTNLIADTKEGMATYQTYLADPSSFTAATSPFDSGLAGQSLADVIVIRRIRHLQHHQRQHYTGIALLRAICCPCGRDFLQLVGATPHQHGIELPGLLGHVEDDGVLQQT